MSDPRRPDQSRRQADEPTQRIRRPYSPYTDPYAGQPAYPRPQDTHPAPRTTDHPTAKLPQHWWQEQFTEGQPLPQPPPGHPKTPRWLWIAAAAAALLVVAMVIALVITSGSPKQTTVPALPAMPSSTGATTTTSAPPASTATSSTPGPSESTSATEAGAVDTVVYSVTGEGRAISITYRDNGDVLHTEFNVALPWSKEVNLPKSGDNANITIVNIGHDVTCTLTVAGAQVREHTGAGLTVCDAPA